MGDDVGVFGDGNCGFLDIACDHADNDTGLFAFVDCFWDALFEGVLDACESQDDEPVLILFGVFVFGFFAGEFLEAD